MSAPARRFKEETFTTAEAAVILTMASAQPNASVTKRAVDSLIDKQLFPAAVVKRHHRTRSLTSTGIGIAAAEFILRRELPVTGLRKRVYQKMAQDGATQGRVAAGETVSVNVEAPLARVFEALGQYRRLMKQIVVDNTIQHGEPVLLGSRVTVYTIAEIAEQGTPINEILRHYPAITAEQIEAACLFAKAHPRRGRPALPSKGKVLLEMSAEDLKAL